MGTIKPAANANEVSMHFRLRNEEMLIAEKTAIAAGKPKSMLFKAVILEKSPRNMATHGSRIEVMAPGKNMRVVKINRIGSTVRSGIFAK